MGIFKRFKKSDTTTSPSENRDHAEQAAHSNNTPADNIKNRGDESTSAEQSKSASGGTTEQQDYDRGNLWQRLQSGLKKTRDVLKTDIRDLFKTEGQLVDDEFLKRLFAILVKTDMGGGPAEKIKSHIESQFHGRVIKFEDVLKIIRGELTELLIQPTQPVRFAQSGPSIILVVGVNGSGKTTSIAKLAHHFQAEGKSVLLGAADTFRAAAVQQLTIWAERLGVDIVKGDQGGDPAAVAHRSVAQAIEQDVDVCIIDTAGRLQTQTNLMKQLEKIFRVIQNQIPAAPHEVFLVLDATAGQNGISQARGFSEAANCTGIILSKLDGTAKGGVIIPIRQEFSIPVLFVGQGEQPEDLAVFKVDEFVAGLFDEV
ncbi:MAG: signal recognition particle-docking protein FtsY [Planctomycetaceae bacterium]|jgi:fused signal recognition particle receptor|nr:signal recognition particle-docking protein FtsY [Planctomycetaceae bacterium]MBT4847066.1 signal recognition particle-docking protein FtsY [Planctomycetaceae bacterium]MBT5123341.1 signal recognition particle-docking protein FtsY [Planctomycetaceae bacterium]MBT5886067.1 signal recognition particle-docking protein FtsY [Planctomycetaceae bacterium]MBT6849216.1 signal recognition particle-docking protein FtsY [Planctomycetaceae bacterium]